MRDVERSNWLFGGTCSALEAVRGILAAQSRAASRAAPATLVDVGTGLADIPLALSLHARSAGVELRAIGIDMSAALVAAARDRLDGAAAGDARMLPVATGAADVVTCSQLLHHFEGPDVRRVISELHRISRGWVVICDLRRSWLAAAGFWLAAVILRFHPVTRRDGFTSVLRGFTAAELEALVLEATGVTPRVRRGAFWRLTAVWRTR
jgi:ubiquinone/menaquinone biosynthesis C-methylase UbiE